MKIKLYTLLAFIFGVLICPAEDEKATGYLDFEDHMNQVKLCAIIGIHYDQFQRYMKEKEINIHTLGGDETYTVTVWEKQKVKELEIVRQKNIQTRFSIIEIYEKP